MAALPVCHILRVGLVLPLLLTLVHSATTGKPESCAVSNNGMELDGSIAWNRLGQPSQQGHGSSVRVQIHTVPIDK